MRKTFARRILAVLLTVLLTASLVPTAFADDPTISLTPAISMRAGDSEVLTAAVSGGDDDADVSWSITAGSEYITIAKNETDGKKCKVTARKEGKAEITATYGGKTATCSVTVGVPEIRVTINSLPTAIPEGDKEKLTATVTVNGKIQTNPTIVWTESSNGSIARIIDITEGTGTTATTVKGVEGVAAGNATITATYRLSGTDYEGKATYPVKVVNASVKSLALSIGGMDGSASDKTAKINTSVGGSEAAKVDVTPVWSDTSASGSFTESQKKKLEWSAEIVSGSEFISLPYSEGKGIPSVPVRGLKPTGTDEKAVVRVTVTYKNVGIGVAEAKKSIPFEVTVSATTQVVITEYAVETREVTLIKGTSKTLRAYVVENGRWKDDDHISWSLGKTGVVNIMPTTGKEITVAALAEGEVTLTAEHTTSKEKRTVTCVVRPESSGGNNPEDPDKPPAGDTLPADVAAQVRITAPTAGTGGVYAAEPGTEDIRLSVTFTKGGSTSAGTFEWSSEKGGFAIYTDGSNRYEVPIVWKSSDENAVKVRPVVSGGSGRFVLVADQPGRSTLSVSVAGSQPDTLTVEVRGFSLKANKFELYENGSMELKDAVVPYGGADAGDLTCWSNDSTVAACVDGKIEAYKPGTTTFTVSDPKRGFRASFDVTVKADPNATIPATGSITIKSSQTLEFSDLLSSFRRQAGEKLSHITGINVASSGGGVYYKYNGTTGAGTGVGAENYYHPYRAGGIPYGGRSLEDLTFVPKKDFAGLVTIHYTGVSEDGKNYVCQLLVTVDPESGASAGISLTTPYNTALRLNGDDFNRVCRERLGVKLDHVVFSQPPERQGTLYTDYVGPGNYGKAVSPSDRYSLKQVNDIWFVPAPGFSGTVTLYYTAYGVGTNAGSFAGQASITVSPENGVAIGGLSFDTVRGSVARFDDERFNTYCREVLQEESWYDRQTLSRIRFDALPSAGEGVLYYDYRSSSNTGTRADTGTSYYYGARNPRIDWLTFVPAADFVGTVKIPFTGWTSDGTSFTGNVEVNVRGGTGYGDIMYVCAPGRSVSFRSSDFANLSRDLTGRTISYIIFRGLPAGSDGSLYYNSSRISTTGARYQNSNIGRLSFRASNSFSGAIDIPFEGWSAGGETFSGVITISTGSSGGSGSSSWGNIRYTSRDGGAAVFDRYDFDGLSQWDTGENVRSVRFQVPSASQGDLYRNYRSSSNQGTRITSGSTSISRSGLDQVAFVPARGYAGTVYIDFTATSNDGSTFDGTVEISVERDTWDVPTTMPARFSDVDANAYYAEPVRWAVENGITSGTSSTTFSPNQTCTVAQILSFLYRANGSPRVTGSNPFTDVRTSDYYYEAALWAHQRGMVSGSALRPFAPCTRASTMEFMWRAAGSPAVSGSRRFDDVSANASYARAVAWATEQRITSGTSSTTFSPNNICTRGQIVSFLYRAMGW